MSCASTSRSAAGRYLQSTWTRASAEQRPAVRNLTASCEMPASTGFEAVLVWKLDRWGRSVAHCVRSIQELLSVGIRVPHSHRVDRDRAESPMSQFMWHLFAALAEAVRKTLP